MHDLKPDLGSGLPGRWWRKPTLPGSEQQKELDGWRPSHGRNGGVGKKKLISMLVIAMSPRRIMR